MLHRITQSRRTRAGHVRGNTQQSQKTLLISISCRNSDILISITIDFNKIIDIDVDKHEWMLFETEEAKT